MHRDLDFRQTGRRICVRDAVLAQRLQQQIRKDAAFLQHQNVLDYSLLIGVHRRFNKAKGQHQARDTWIAKHTKELEKLLHVLQKERDSLSPGQADPILNAVRFVDFANFAFDSTAAATSLSPPPLDPLAPASQSGLSIFQQLQGGMEGSTRPEGRPDEEVRVGVYVCVCVCMYIYVWR